MCDAWYIVKFNSQIPSISGILKNETDTPINRVFTMYIESDEASDAIFSDEEYLKIRGKYYDKSVSFLAIVSKYDK